MQDSSACSDIIKFCHALVNTVICMDLHCMVFNCLAVCWRKPLTQSLQLSIVVHPIRSKGWIHLQYTRITVAFCPWNNEKFKRANPTAARTYTANESTKLSFNVSKWIGFWEFEDGFFFSFLPHQTRIDKKHQMLKKGEGLMIFRPYLKLWEWISVLKNVMNQPIKE